MPLDRVEHRPWGYYTVLADEPDHKVKRVVIHPGQRLSLQRHTRRKEHWHAISGQAILTLEAEELSFSAGQSIDIPESAWHRIQNEKGAPFVFIEVQTGAYFGEDDIERREDDYGRMQGHIYG